MKLITVSFFSAGVSSAVATKMAIDQIDRIIYTHINDQHPDTLRFVRDCEEWFGKPVEVIQSQKYKSVEDACRTFINGAHGAACTTALKRQVRIEWEKHQTGPLRYVWGIDKKESHRSLGLERAMPMVEHLFPLIAAGMSKTDAHKVLTASGIKRPLMYDLGYHNNNCVGCVKGGMGYWNKIRRDFPEVFAARAAMERRVGASCITEKVKMSDGSIKRERIFLDELDPERGRNQSPIVADCGIFCEMIGL